MDRWKESREERSMRLSSCEVERQALKPIAEYRKFRNVSARHIEFQVVLGPLVGHKRCDVRVFSLLGPERVIEPVRTPLPETDCSVTYLPKHGFLPSDNGNKHRTGEFTYS